MLRDAHGVLVLEFQRPDDALDVQLELAELVIARDEVCACANGVPSDVVGLGVGEG